LSSFIFEISNLKVSFYFSYHSLEHSEVLNGEVQGSKVTTRTIDETIARLNETIEEIRSVDHVIRSESTGRRSVSPGKESRFSPKRETTPPITNSVLRESSPLRTVNGIIPTDSAVPLGRRISLENRISPLRSVMEKEKHPSAAPLPMSPSVNHMKESRIFSQSSQVSQSGQFMCYYFIIPLKSKTTFESFRLASL